MSYSVSIVVPVLNEEQNVAPLHAEIVEVCSKNGYTFEVIFVDDGSTDQTVKMIKQLHPVTLVQLRRNFGQTAALDAGIRQARYDYIIPLDGDRQNDPNDIPLMLAYLQENDLDVVAGWRVNRRDSNAKRFVSRGANYLRRVFINDGIHDSGCTLKVFKHECFEHLTLYGEMHRFIPGLLQIQGFKVGEIPVNHRARTAGQSKYNWRRTVKGLLDMISVWFWRKYAVRPLHLLGGIGIIFLMMSVLSGIKTVYDYFSGFGVSESGWALLTVFFFLGGVQFLISGLMTDIMIKTYFESSRHTSYNVKQVLRQE